MSLDKDYLKDLFTDEVKGCLEGDSSLPKVTSKDDGKILKVVDGTWQMVDLVPPLYLSFLGNAEFTLGTANNTKNWDGTLEYSTDKKTWSEWDGTAISSAGNNLYLRGTGNTKITGNSADYRFVFTGTDTLKIACKGNIENLLDYETVSAGEHPTMAEYCYSGMFAGCTALTTAPELPATTLTGNCYEYMFEGCTALTTAPALPAATLADYCYDEMFRHCIALTTAPALPATTLVKSCYNRMFQECTSLTTAPALPATTLADYCYSSMFYGCTSLTTAPELPATTLADYCYAYMLQNCISLVSAPELPATTLKANCYQGAFYGCTALTTAPKLPATTLADYCYGSMFNGCTNIKLSTTQTGDYQTEYRIPTTGTGTTASGALTDMFANTGGTFTGSPYINTIYYTSNTVV